MASPALALFVLYLALAIGARTLLQKRWTGSSGFRGISGRPGSVGWFGRVLFAGVLGPGLAAPVLDLTGAGEPISLLDGPLDYTVGVILYGLGLAGTLGAQVAMGRFYPPHVTEDDYCSAPVPARDTRAYLSNRATYCGPPRLLGRTMTLYSGFNA
jgi:hypothetical protein